MTAKKHLLSVCVMLIAAPSVFAQPTDTKPAPRPTIPLTPVRIAGVMQPGFVQTQICRVAQKGVECEPAVIHAASDTVISVGGRWISACQANGQPVTGKVPDKADIQCRMRSSGQADISKLRSDAQRRRAAQP